jgi:hypothetical protein
MWELSSTSLRGGRRMGAIVDAVEREWDSSSTRGGRRMGADSISDSRNGRQIGARGGGSGTGRRQVRDGE